MASLSATAFSGDSVMAAQMRSHDWQHSPLGAPDTWPPSLRTAVDMMLHSAFPMSVAWGPQHIILYNDAYIPILGERHAGALGQSFAALWPEVWPELQPQVKLVMAGKPVFFEDYPL